MKRKMSREAFVRLWQCATSLQDFCAKTGYCESAAGTIANRLRRKGVPLKRMAKPCRPHPVVPGYERLAQIAVAGAPLFPTVCA